MVVFNYAKALIKNQAEGCCRISTCYHSVVIPGELSLIASGDFRGLNTCFFQAGKYDESLKHLEGLQELNKEDYKISMNEAIVKFYRSGQTTTGALKQSLMLLKNQVSAAGAHVL